MEPIEFGEFLKRTGFARTDFAFDALQKVEKVVSLRAIAKPLMATSMTVDYLEKLLGKVGLISDPDNKIYNNCRIRRLRIDPNALYIGQKYVYRDKYIAIMENFRDLLIGFTVPRGISKLTPLIIFGRDAENQITLAHYIPPIFEVHSGKMIIMDGIHRDFIVKNAGTTIEAVIIEQPTAPFPCELRSWKYVEITSEKPAKIEDRYFELKPDLFRDLKGVGIDG